MLILITIIIIRTNFIYTVGSDTCGSPSTRCRAALPGWWRPSRAPSGRSRCTAHCLARSGPSGGDSPPLPETPCQPSPPSPGARWQSRCCLWRAKRSGPNAVGQVAQLNPPPNNIFKIKAEDYLCIWLHSLYLNVIVVANVFVGGSDACLDRLDPSLPQLLRLGLQHAAPAGRARRVSLFIFIIYILNTTTQLGIRVWR